MRSDIYRVIDVNFNRATEGLRVVEEVCRFFLEDKQRSLLVKKLRGELLAAIKKIERLLATRKAWEDVGRRMYTEEEGRRINIESIFRANMKRAEEAVRCLEEFSKLLNPKSGKAFKNIRFKLYELEKQLAPKVSKMVKLDFDLYVVTDPRRDHVATARKALAGGVKIIQLRDKKMPRQNYFRLAKKIAGMSRKAGAVFIVNDYWDMVEELGADGVHLGQEDLARISLRKVRLEIGSDKIIGVYTHSFSQALAAEKMGADYISVGPLFATPSKPHTKPVGLKLLGKVVKRVKIPVVAIGGIDKSNLKKVLRTGCLRAAVIRAAEQLI